VGLVRNIQRIDHVSMVYRDENVEQAVETLERTLGVRFPPPIDVVAIRSWVDWDSGLEVFAPAGTAADLDATGPLAAFLDMIHAHLDTRGEGLFSIVFGVADIDAACERAAAAGASVATKHDGPDPSWPWAHRFTRIQEAELGYVNGVYLVLGQVEPTAAELAAP
jgi:hypothetical protein